MDPAEFEVRGLYDPHAPNASDRLALLEWLTEQGVSVDQMVEAHSRGNLIGVAGDLALRPGPRLKLEDVAQRAELTLDEVERLRIASGLPAADDETLFSASDAETMKLFALGAEFFGDEALLRFTRVLGSSLARTADAAVSLFLSDVASPLTAAGGGDLALAQANLQAIGALNVLPQLMETIFRAHMELAIRRSQTAGAQTQSLFTTWLAIGFVDLVGFTPLSQQLPVAELGSVVDAFETAAYDIVASRGGRVVKLIGDEVMFVALDSTAACEIALALVERFDEPDARVTPRGGVGVGEILTRGGDYYGPVVNLASRIGEQAVPNEILASREVRQDVSAREAALVFDPAGRRMLKGFDEPVELFSVARA